MRYEWPFLFSLPPSGHSCSPCPIFLVLVVLVPFFDDLFSFLFFDHELDWLLEYVDPDSSSGIVSKPDMLVCKISIAF